MKASNRILFIITQSSPWGGAQRYVYDLTVSLRKKGWDVTVATGAAPTVGVAYMRPLHTRLHTAGVQITNLKYLTRSVNPIHNILSTVEIYRLCRRLKPDIVHLNSSMAGVVGSIGAYIARVTKIVYTVHGLVTKEPLPAYVKFVYWLAEWIAGKFRDATICVSEDDRRAVVKQNIAPASKTVTIPIGIDPSIKFYERKKARDNLCVRMTPPQSSHNAGEDNDYPLPNDLEGQGEVWIGTIAGLYKTKGLETIIKAALHLQRVGALLAAPLQFVIIGEGPERTRLQSQINDHQLTNTVFLLGPLPDAAQYLKAFDLFVLPSIKEGMPYTILEAIAAGVPIVATNVGGIPEIYEGINNPRSRVNDSLSSYPFIPIPPHNSHQLANAIQTILAPTTVGATHASPLQLPVIFTLDRMVEETIKVYNNKRGLSKSPPCNCPLSLRPRA